MFLFDTSGGIFMTGNIGTEEADFLELESRLGYNFTNKDLLLAALTHSTYAYESRQDKVEDNERLEFVGDGILDFVVAEVLYRKREESGEGYLSKTRSLIVCEPTLAEIAAQLNLGLYLRLGRGEEGTGGRDKASNLANAVEALFAAIYFDGGFEKAREVIQRTMEGPIDAALSGRLVFDYKSKILERAQTKGHAHVVRFDIVDERGPVHDREFTAVVFLDDEEFGRGIGSSKKQAEQIASKDALREWEKRFS